MPQMSPLNWFFLFIMFTFSFLIFNILNYYSSTNSNSLNVADLKLNNDSKNILLTWKW